MPRRTTLLSLAATTTLALAGVGAAATSTASAASSGGGGDRVRLVADLDPLNNSGASGAAAVRVRGGTLERVEVVARGLSPEDDSHLMHIHFGADARHECPTFRDDANGDNILTVGEGVPAYGGVAVALTTSGDTSPASGGALDRMPVATDGAFSYRRDDIRIPRDQTAVLAGIRRGQGVVVIHGIDRDGDGDYTAAAPQGAPSEISDPAACGVLRRADHREHEVEVEHGVEIEVEHGPEIEIEVEHEHAHERDDDRGRGRGGDD